MRLSLIISFLVHCSIVLAGLIALPGPEEYVVANTESIPIDVLSVDEFTKIRPQAPKEKPVEKPAPPEEKQAAVAPTEPAPEAKPEPKPAAVEDTPQEPPPAPPPVEAKPEPAPAPEPEPAPPPVEAKPEPEKVPEKVVETKPVPKPRVRPRPPKRVVKKKKPKFDLDRIAALLNKDPDVKPPQRRSPDRGQPVPDETARLQGRDQTVSLSDQDALRAQIERCWNPLVGVQGAEDLVVRLKISLKRDGSLSRPPEVVNRRSDPSFTIAAERAMRAVRRCQPFEMPANKYSVWREIILNFNPRELIQG